MLYWSFWAYYPALNSFLCSFEGAGENGNPPQAIYSAPLFKKIPVFLFLCYHRVINNQPRRLIMKILIISIMVFVWSSASQGYACTASPTNNDPTTITTCYTKMLIHFRDTIQEQLSFQYANHLANTKLKAKLNETSFRRRYYGKMLDELEQIQRLRHRLLYPDPRPAVRCEAPSGGSE